MAIVGKGLTFDSGGYNLKVLLLLLLRAPQLGEPAQVARERAAPMAPTPPLHPCSHPWMQAGAGSMIELMKFDM